MCGDTDGAVMVTDPEIDEAIKLWNSLAVDLGLKYIKTARNKKMRAEAFRFLTWAKEHRIDWPHYLEGQSDYYRRLGRRLPPFRMLIRSNPELRDAIVRRGIVIEAEQKIPVVTTVTRKLRPATERFKSFYVGREELCARYQRDSGGYNPKSKWCARCPVKSSCIELGRA